MCPSAQAGSVVIHEAAAGPLQFDITITYQGGLPGLLGPGGGRRHRRAGLLTGEVRGLLAWSPEQPTEAHHLGADPECIGPAA